jgi:hypothetical protein
VSSEQGTHFWFMTIQTIDSVASYQATRTPSPGQTRLDLYYAILNEIVRLHPESRGGAVIAFDIQPNKL